MNQRSSLLLAAALCLCQLAIPLRAQQTLAPKDLYYIIVDKSQSIGGSIFGDPSLVKPIRSAVEGLVSALPPESQVTLQFFDTKPGPSKTWSSMDDDSKRDLLNYFNNEFKPRDKTCLFGTVGDALSRIRSDLAQFRSISVYILSDGDDTEGSRKYHVWADIERLACELKRAHPYFSVCWYTLGFKPKDKPSDGGCVCVVDVPDPQLGFALRLSPPSADFKANPTNAKVRENLLFVLKSGANADQTIWDFGDNTSVTNQNRTANFMQEHSYSKLGKYAVKVTVAGAGGSATNGCIVEISDEPALKAAFKWSPEIGRAGTAIQFVDESSGNPDTFSWVIGKIGRAHV